MNDLQKSDCCEVAMKLANKPDGVGTESVERRRQAEGNTSETHTRRTQSRVSVSPGLDRVRESAKAKKKERFTALLHLIDVDRLRAAYFALKRDASPGIDGVSWEQYGQDLEEKLVDLHGRIHRGAYRALPSKRQYIPKPDGQKRPLGIAALEDKVAQRAAVGRDAVTMLLGDPRRVSTDHQIPTHRRVAGAVRFSVSDLSAPPQCLPPP